MSGTLAVPWTAIASERPGAARKAGPAQPHRAVVRADRLALGRRRALGGWLGLLRHHQRAQLGRICGGRRLLAVDEAGRRVVPGPLSQARIAERLGASRAMVNRLLQDLARGGYIEVTRARIVLLKKLPPRW